MNRTLQIEETVTTRKYSGTTRPALRSNRQYKHAMAVRKHITAIIGSASISFPSFWGAVRIFAQRERKSKRLDVSYAKTFAPLSQTV